MQRVARELQKEDIRKEAFGLAHKRVFGYAEWDLRLPSGEPVRGGILRENGIRVGHADPPAWLRSFPTPLNSLIGRDLCGEFQLLAGVGSLLDSAPPGRLEGELHLFTSSTPCSSCVAAVRQFQQRFAGVRLFFSNAERLPANFGAATLGHPIR